MQSTNLSGPSLCSHSRSTQKNNDRRAAADLVYAKAEGLSGTFKNRVVNGEDDIVFKDLLLTVLGSLTVVSNKIRTAVTVLSIKRY